MHRDDDPTLTNLPKVHPRVAPTQQAHLALADALMKITATFNLTMAEQLLILAQAQSEILQFCVRDERKRSRH